MKKYILTEEQITKALTSGGIKKGIGLKINEGDSFYYKSVIKEFDNEDDFEEWKDNLPEDQKVVGIIDIKNDTITESIKPEELKRLRRIQEVRDIIDFQMEIQYPCNFDDGEEYADFCIGEGMRFFYGDEGYEREDGIFADETEDHMRDEIEEMMIDEYYSQLVEFWEEESKDC